jgi:hypothetical protein
MNTPIVIPWGQTHGRTHARTNIYSIFRDKLSLPDGGLYNRLHVTTIFLFVPNGLHLENLDCTFLGTFLPAQHVCSDWLGRLHNLMVFNDDSMMYHITNNILKFFQSVYLTLSFWPHFLWHLLGPSSKGQSILNVLFNTHAPARSLQKDDL